LSSKRRFLVDTGAEISLLPRDSVKPLRSKLDPLELFAANNTRIATYGTYGLSLNLGLRREFICDFVVAAVPYAIIGADFLQKFNLLVDIANKRLMDNVTSLHSKGFPSSSSLQYQRISSISPSIKDPIRALLAKYQRITIPRSTTEPVQHEIQHHI